MIYTVYKTTNTINGKYYIGVHKTHDPNDDYLGSGKYLKHAIKKYGRDNFKKEILFTFDDKEKAYLKEKELITFEIIESNFCYNIIPGGSGGFDYLNKTGLNIKNKDYKKMSKRGMEAVFLKYGKIPKTKEDIMRAVATRKTKPFNNGWSGRKHSDETKKKMSESAKRYSGSKHSQFGTIWITDGTLNKKINKDDVIPHGWYKGRTIKTDIN